MSLKQNKKMPDCPIVLTQQLVSGKWKIILLYLLSQKKWRFNELHRELPGITQATLSKQLKELESDGLVVRRVYSEIPPKVEYGLSASGLEFQRVFEAMKIFGENYTNYFNTDLLPTADD